MGVISYDSIKLLSSSLLTCDMVLMQYSIFFVLYILEIWLETKEDTPADKIETKTKFINILARFILFALRYEDSFKNDEIINFT